MGANKIVVKDKRATIAGTETLCGSIASLAECVQNMRQALLDGETKTTGEIDKNKFIVESIEAATLHPALGRIFCIDHVRCGSLDLLYVALFIILLVRDIVFSCLYPVICILFYSRSFSLFSIYICCRQN
jgi:hypothetical protein